MNINNKADGSVYSADEWNEFKNEIQNFITSSGQTLAGNSLQLQQAVSRFASNASSYIDSGIANAYSLVAIGTNTVISQYIDGAVVSFKAGSSNTGNSTLAIAGLAAKTIKKNGFADVLTSGDVVADRVYNAFYSLADDAFELSEYSATSSTVADATETVKGILELATQAEADGGVDDERAITALKLSNRPGGGQSLSTIGYRILDGGMIMQWGSLAFAGNTTTNITLPTAYTTAHLWAGVSMYIHGSDVDVNPGADMLSLTQIQVRNDSASAITLRWFSIGE